MTKDSFIQAVQFIWIQGGSLPDKRIRTLNLLNQYEAEIEQSHKYVVMQAEGSDVSEGAAVASSAVEKGVSEEDQEAIKHGFKNAQEMSDYDNLYYG